MFSSLQDLFKEREASNKEMQFKRFLLCFMFTNYLTTFVFGKLCEGPYCHQDSLSGILLFNTTVESLEKPTNLISFQGVNIGQKLNKKCCYNGGICFLGSFCICPKEFTGRRCEHEKWPRICAGGILHGEWVVNGCSYCRCFSGKFYCLLPIPECDADAFKSAGSISQQKWIVIILSIVFYICF